MQGCISSEQFAPAWQSQEQRNATEWRHALMAVEIRQAELLQSSDLGCARLLHCNGDGTSDGNSSTLRVAARPGRPENIGCAGSLVRTSLQSRFSLFAGKKQGISAKIGVFGRRASRQTAITRCVSGRIPCAQEQGIFSSEQGISGRDQG
jgi:hypothetical protein